MYQGRRHMNQPSVLPFLCIPLRCRLCGEVLRDEWTPPDSPIYHHDYQRLPSNRPPCENYGKRYRVTDDLKVIEV